MFGVRQATSSAGAPQRSTACTDIRVEESSIRFADHHDRLIARSAPQGAARRLDFAVTVSRCFRGSVFNGGETRFSKF